MFGVAALDDGSVILAGRTDGSWDGPNRGRRDMAMVTLDASERKCGAGRWEAGLSLFAHQVKVVYSHNGEEAIQRHARSEA